MRALQLLLMTLPGGLSLPAQDTFSITAVDSVTGEVGSAGASCLNLFLFGYSDPGFLAQQLPGVGSINAQALYLAANQNAAMARLQAGDVPDQVISWLQANDAQNNPQARQYGVARLDGNGGADAAAFTGTQCLSYAGHRAGPNYAIQGNILLGPQILDDMEQNFLNTTGTLADKLMAALQGANVVGADTRCASNGTSSLFAFLEVAQPSDPFNQPSLSLGVRLGYQSGEPIDSLQALYDAWNISTALASAPDVHLVRIAPNPVHDLLVVHGLTQAAHPMMILDATGRAVPTGTYRRTGHTEWDVSGLEPGSYLIVFAQQGLRTSGRFVKE